MDELYFGIVQLVDVLLWLLYGGLGPHRGEADVDELYFGIVQLEDVLLWLLYGGLGPHRGEVGEGEVGGSQPSEKGANGHTKNQIAFDRRLFATNVVLVISIRFVLPQ